MIRKLNKNLNDLHFEIEVLDSSGCPIDHSIVESIDADVYTSGDDASRLSFHFAGTDPWDIYLNNTSTGLPSLPDGMLYILATLTFLDGAYEGGENSNTILYPQDIYLVS